MAYRHLRKFYYDSQEIYQNEYDRRFSCESTIKLDFEIKGRQAFFTQSSDVIDLLANILRRDKQISQLCEYLPQIAMRQYMRKCLIDEIVLSNNIEGVHSSRREIGQALTQLETQSEKKGKRMRFLGLVNRYAKLNGNERVSLSTCQDIRKIYDEIVLPEVAQEDRKNIPDGKIFRKDQASIYGRDGRIIHSGLAPESEIVSAIEKALTFLNNDNLEPLYRICIFHYLIEYIHPFYDGNGRLGRFILSYCIQEHLEPILAFRISETIQENVNEYYKAFTVCNDFRNLGDLTPFLIMLLNMVSRSAEDLRDSLIRKITSMNKYGKVLSSYPGCDSDRMKELCEYLIEAALFSETGISTEELLSTMQVSINTLKKYLDEVDKMGLLVIQTSGRKKLYQINTDKLDQELLPKQGTASF